MADYKSMYYHLAGRTATAVDILDTSIKMLEANVKVMMTSVEAMQISAESLNILKEKLKMAQQITEDMFVNSANDDCEKNDSAT